MDSWTPSPTLHQPYTNPNPNPTLTLALTLHSQEIFHAEVQRDIATVMYSNLKDFRIEMPQQLIVGAGDGAGES